MMLKNKKPQTIYRYLVFLYVLLSNKKITVDVFRTGCYVPNNTETKIRLQHIFFLKSRIAPHPFKSQMVDPN